MTAPWRATRRRRYAKRAHDVASRPVADNSKIVWYRGPDGDHAFGGPTGYMRSKCRETRWDVRMRIVEGTVHPCLGCLAAITPRPVAAPTESELRAMDGDR